MPAAPDPHARHPEAGGFPFAPAWPLAVALVLAVVAAYWNSLNAPFLFDDNGAVVDNPTIRHLGSLAALDPPADGSTTTGRPVVNFSYAINYAIGGANVWSYHALNIAIHALAALALMGIVRRTLLSAGPESAGGPQRAFAGRSSDGGSAISQAALWSFLAALLWALHPLQTESVVCIAQRTESLCGFFYLLTLYGFVRATAPVAASSGFLSSRRAWLAVSIAACLAGMGTKEVMVTAPVMVLLYDRTFVAGSFAAACRRRWRYYAALGSTWLLLAWLVTRAGGARGASAGFGLGVSWWTYLLKQSEAIVLYLKLSLWPHPLVLDYGTAVVNSLADVWWQATAVLALLAFTVWALVRKPVVGFFGAWFFVILAPSSSVVPLVAQTMAEHRMYLPLAALAVAGAVGCHRLSLRFGRSSSRGRWAILPLALAAASAFATVLRNRDYRDAVAIWTDNVAQFPQGARGHNNLAWALQQAGRSGEANAEFARAVALLPGYVTAHYNWGVALLDQHRAADAVAQFEIAVRLAPDHADAHLYLGNALMQVQRAAEAVPHYEQALRLKPGPDVHYNLGVALLELGRSGEAVAHLRAALQLQPDLSEAHYQLGRALEKAGRGADAKQEYLETLRLAPEHLDAHRKLGLLLAHDSQFAPAAEHFRAVLQHVPADADAHANLGNVLLLEGQVRDAIAQYEESLRLRPDDARTRENLKLARESLP